MGAKTQILLVIALLVGSAQAAERVDARQHSAFWLWSGVKAGDELRNAQTVYLHQGEVLKQAGEVVFQRLGLPVSRLTFPSIWLTVRFTTLDVPPMIVPRIVRLMQRWQTAGNQVVGLQIDFDAGTYQLADYARFLRQLRQQLPPEFALGVTGLLDWAKTGDIATLNALAVDELVVQSYQDGARWRIIRIICPRSADCVFHSSLDWCKTAAATNWRKPSCNAPLTIAVRWSLCSTQPGIKPALCGDNSRKDYQ